VDQLCGGGPPERRQRLDEIGFVWDPNTADWEAGFAAQERFKQREGHSRVPKGNKEGEGHCRVPRGHKEDGFNLGAWVSRQRTNKDTLSPERRQRLEEIGFVWKIRVPPSTDN
jgi:hypothetical protein